MSSEKFCLRWNDFEANISSAFRELRDDKDFFDVTIACDDDQIQAHKVILSACSPFFRNILRRNPHQNPLLYLKGVKFTDLQSVLNFMYHGEVNVAQDELNSFLAVAEDLRVKGLTQNNASSSKPKEAPYRPPPPKSPISRPPDREPPAIKRPRPAPSQSYQQDDDIQEVVPVKSEPREHPIIPPTYSTPVPPTPDTQQQMVASEQHHDGQLQELDDSMYGADDSYDDYGGYDNTQYGVAGSMGGQAMDTSKGQISSVEDFDKFMEKEPETSGYFCNICQMYRKRGKADVRNHIESKHFPNSFSYNCHICSYVVGTNKALSRHVQNAHSKPVSSNINSFAF